MGLSHASYKHSRRLNTHYHTIIRLSYIIVRKEETVYTVYTRILLAPEDVLIKICLIHTEV